MAKTIMRYACTNCGAIALSWTGKCQQCGAWNTLQEEPMVGETTSTGSLVSTGRALSALSVGSSVRHDQKRLLTTMGDIDAVFGGGIVAGSVSLLAGQPGVSRRTRF